MNTNKHVLISPSIIYSYFLLIPGLIRLFFNNLDIFVFSYLIAFSFTWMIGGIILMSLKITTLTNKLSIGIAILLFFLILVI